MVPLPFSGMNAETPQVSYVKAIDVWMGACTAFIFSALIEFTVVNYLSRRHRRCPANGRRNGYRSTHVRNGGEGRADNNGEEKKQHIEMMNREGPSNHSLETQLTQVKATIRH